MLSIEIKMSSKFGVFKSIYFDLTILLKVLAESGTNFSHFGEQL